MTTGISLVRENTESMRPPRALWVPFPLGRPLGKADDPRFQRQVISHALGLLNRSEGPVLDDFPLDLPNTDQEAIEACPVSFPVKRQGKDTWANFDGVVNPEVFNFRWAACRDNAVDMV